MSQRFRVASNRHRLLCEDVRQVTSQQHALRSAQYQLVNESAALDSEELRWVEAFDSLSHSLATAQERQRKLVAAQAVATRQAARAGDEAQQLAQQLVEAAARAGELASLVLAKIRERMLVVKQVQAIKNELKESVLLFASYPRADETSGLVAARMGISRRPSSYAVCWSGWLM
jgi:hypothetical protein